MSSSDSFGARSTLAVSGRNYEIFRLGALQERFDVARLPYSIKVLLENVLRLEDGRSVTAADVEAIASWDAAAEPSVEIPFQPARVLMQDFTGVPAVVDLAAMRDAMEAKLGGDPAAINPLVDVDLVIESVVEDLAVKKDLFAELDSICKPETILATNTSTLPVVEMAMATGRPDLVCGIHFFNPAPAMALVEVVRPITASDTTVASAVDFAAACGKDPVEVKDQAGFIVNALLFPYLNNAVRLYEQGVATVADIDTAMKGGCGFPMGPFALLDLVGLDTSLAILDALYEEFRDPNYAAVPLLRRMVAAELLGRKSGQGFLDYRR